MSNNVLTFTFTVPQDYEVSLGTSSDLELGLDSGTPFIALITPDA